MAAFVPQINISNDNILLCELFISITKLTTIEEELSVMEKGTNNTWICYDGGWDQTPVPQVLSKHGTLTGCNDSSIRIGIKNPNDLDTSYI